MNQHVVGHPLLAAELVYQSYTRDDWELLLARTCQLGANTVVIPVSWAWHVVRADVRDFDGHSHPRRDLRGFVELCGKFGLHVVLKLDGSGEHIPDWWLHAHSESQSLRAD